MNVARLLAGHQSTPLSERGRAQAALLGARLAEEAVDCIYSSDLPRAVQTTEEICRFVKAPVVFDVRVRERCWGVLDGIPVSEYQRKLEQSTCPFYQFKPEGGESIEDLEQRAAPFLEMLKHAHRDQCVLISGHHAVNKAMLKYLLGFGWGEWRALHQENTCLNEVYLEEGVARAARINCSIHLASFERELK